MGAATISETVSQAGVGVETIRFDERRGQVTPPPKLAGGGFRVYRAEVVKCIRSIQRA